jgi:hypothetical protein
VEVDDRLAVDDRQAEGRSHGLVADHRPVGGIERAPRLRRAAHGRVRIGEVEHVLWARLDRELTDLAVWLPTVTGKQTDIVSKRVGNYHYHPLWGVLIDQLWVR